MYTNISAIDCNHTGEISHIKMPEPVPNPVYFDEQGIQVSDELYPNGEPNFFKAYEAQEFTMDFFVDAEDGVAPPFPERRRERDLDPISEQAELTHNGSMERLHSNDAGSQQYTGAINAIMVDEDSDDDIKKPPLEDEDKKLKADGAVQKNHSEHVGTDAKVTGNGHMPLQRQVPLRSSLRRKGSLSPSSKRVHFDAPREKTNSDSASSPSEDVVTVSANKMNTIKNMRKKGTGTDSCK